MSDIHVSSPRSASATSRFARNTDRGAGRARIRRNPEEPCIPVMDSALSSAFNSLNAIEQQVLALVYFGDQDQQQIARQLRIPAATVATVVAHGLQSLAINLAPPRATAIGCPAA